VTGKGKTKIKATGTVTRVTVYTRVSEARDAAVRAGTEGETSTARQLAQCRAYADSQGWQIVGEHTDRGISAFSGVERPGWRSTMADVEQEQTDAVLVFALDRAGRNTAGLLRDVEIMKEHGVAFVSATQPIDTGSTYGGIILAVLAAVAETESAIKRERALSKFAEQAANGEWTGRAFGYTPEGVVDPAQAEAIRSGAATLLNGGSLRTVARDWNAAGLTTTKGIAWRPETVRQHFRSPRSIAMREADGELVAGSWDAILTRTDWDRLQALFDDRKDRTIKSARYLLTGLAYCGVDGHKLVGRPVSGKPRYICTHGGPSGTSVHLGIDAATLDAYVDQRAARMVLVSPETVADLTTVAPELRERLAAVEAEQADIIDDDTLSPTFADRRYRKLEADRVELVDSIEKAAAPWSRMADEIAREPRDGEHRAAVEELVERIVIVPAPNRSRVPIAQRATIEWREGVEAV
jgi:DNA invertase Pin-like site-specific DNA recombinase